MKTKSLLLLLVVPVALVTLSLSFLSSCSGDDEELSHYYSLAENKVTRASIESGGIETIDDDTLENLPELPAGEAEGEINSSHGRFTVLCSWESGHTTRPWNEIKVACAVENTPSTKIDKDSCQIVEAGFVSENSIKVKIRYHFRNSSIMYETPYGYVSF